MSLTPDDIRAIVAAFDASDWTELSLSHGTTHLALSRSDTPMFRPNGETSSPTGRSEPTAAAVASWTTSPPAPVAPDGAPPTTHNGPTSEPAGLQVTAPTVGLFWAAPQPGAPPFVEVGQTVGPDDTVAIVEVMKLMSHVKAGVAGTVVAVMVENGAMVEHGDTLLVIAPEA